MDNVEGVLGVRTPFLWNREVEEMQNTDVHYIREIGRVCEI